MLIVSIPKTKRIPIAREKRAVPMSSRAKTVSASTETICGISFLSLSLFLYFDSEFNVSSCFCVVHKRSRRRLVSTSSGNSSYSSSYYKHVLISSGDGSDEPHNCTYTECTSSQFKCDNLRCIASNQKCNGRNDCFDNSDEKSSVCQNSTCPVGHFTCNNRNCVPMELVCNGVRGKQRSRIKNKTKPI